MPKTKAKNILLDGLTDGQEQAVRSHRRRTMVIAGAGSGKTEVMARRVAWWVAHNGVKKRSIIAFTFTERAAEEMKFRIRRQISHITPEGEDPTLGDMYVGTIHAFCMRMLRELAPDPYHAYSIVDDVARLALLGRRFWDILADFKAATGRGQYAAQDLFLEGYDLLNEYNLLDVDLPDDQPPIDPAEEEAWFSRAGLRTKGLGRSKEAKTFGEAAAKFYAYLRCRRFLDFSTSQSELVKLLQADANARSLLRERYTHVVVDEVQDLNPVQHDLLELIVGKGGTLTAVGDHRQAIFGWRGGRVDLMAELGKSISKSRNGVVVELEENFRSTPLIVDVANRWARTIHTEAGLTSPDMIAGNGRRHDAHDSHVATLLFETREDEATWIAKTVRRLVRPDGKGAEHDTTEGSRGLTLSDIAILLRSSTSARQYMEALREEGIGAIFRAGPDLFSQPEVLLATALMCRAAGVEEFYGHPDKPAALPGRTRQVLNSAANVESVVPAACRVLRAEGLELPRDAPRRLLKAAELVEAKISGTRPAAAQVGRLKSGLLRKWLMGSTSARRIFPQTLYHMFLDEIGVKAWDDPIGRGATALFHLGQLSSLITGLETPGWTNAYDFKQQMIALCQWGAKNARIDEAPLLVQPDAVTIATVHAAKGLQWPAVFVADVVTRRFPSGFAKHVPTVPWDEDFYAKLDPRYLADNENLDDERRLMYVALTRAERFLYVTGSKDNNGHRSRFFKEVGPMVEAAGGRREAGTKVPQSLRFVKSAASREDRLVTSFSDLRYYLECPHDFYLRKVLGFAPTIDQAFGYGLGVHNVMRELHQNPTKWVRLLDDPPRLDRELRKVVERLMYLRHTVGEPAENMRRRAREIAVDYLTHYRDEMSRLEFEPERPFETLFEDDNVLISGAIDLVRLDDPPSVTIIDFKSGRAESDRMMLDEEEMKLQILLYAHAARRELEYEPKEGLVRYLADPDTPEMPVDFDDDAMASAARSVSESAVAIRDRNFHEGPRKARGGASPEERCRDCDLVAVCGLRSSP